MSRPTHHCEHETIKSNISGKKIHVFNFSHDCETDYFVYNRYVDFKVYLRLELELEILRLKVKFYEQDNS